MRLRRIHLTSCLHLLVLLSLASLKADAQGPTVYRVSTFAGMVVNETAEIDATLLALNLPIGMARDSKGNLYIADYGNHRVRKVSPNGKANLLAGTGAIGGAGNDGPAINAQVSFPRTLALDGDKYLYVGESNNSRVRRIDLATGIITLALGDSQSGFNGDGNSGPATRITEVLGLAVDAQGNLFVADAGSHRIRRLSASDGRVTTITGTGTAGASADGVTATSTLISRPGAVAVHPNGDIYFSELGNRRIRRISNGVVTTVAGNPSATLQTGQALQIQVTTCIGMVFSADGNTLYFTEEASDTVRALNLSNQQVSAIAGNGTATFSGDNGPATQAGLANPNHIVVEPGGLIVADASNHRIRRIVLGGLITTVAGGGALSIGDGGLATQATLNRPRSVRLDPRGNMIIADQANCVVRRIDTSGRISTVAGTVGACQLSGLLTAFADSQGTIYWSTTQGVYVRGPGDGPLGRLRIPLGSLNDILLSKDEQTIYLLQSNQAAARIWASGASVISGQGNAFISPFAGLTPGNEGDGSPAISNFLFVPTSMADDKAGNLYIVDAGNRDVRRVDIASRTITSVIKLPELFQGGAIAVDASNNIFLAAGGRVFGFNSRGVPISVTGASQAGLTADGFDGLNARFNEPAGLAVNSDGRIFVADRMNNLIRRLTPVTVATIEAVSAKPLASGAVPIQVLAKGSDGSPLGGLAILFSAVPANATLSAPMAITNQLGVATVNVTLPAGAPAIVTASLAYDFPPLRIDVTATGSGVPGASELPAISTVISLAGFGGSKRIASGSWVEIYGSNLAPVTQSWAEADFQNGRAPTELRGIRVLMNGIPAYLQYISPGQINCQAPDGLGERSVSVVIVGPSGESNAFAVTAATRVPGLLAPQNFRVGPRQHVAAILPDLTYVGSDALLIPGVTFRPAAPGERILLFGIGFGPSNPNIPAGQIATQQTSVPNVEVRFGDKIAIAEYAGAAGGLVGIYQLNIVVPEGVSGDMRLSVTVDGVAVDQELWIATK